MAALVACGVLLMAAARAARADRDIVFSAQWYRWEGYDHGPYSSKLERTLTERGAYHLYRINPDGTGLKRITSGANDDSMPRWSPDGKEIVFARRLADGKYAVCVVSENGGAVKRLMTVEEDYRWRGRLSWSPDGRRIAIFAYGFYGDGTHTHIVVVDLRTGRGQAIQNGKDFAWSPDGTKLYVATGWGFEGPPRQSIWTFGPSGQSSELNVKCVLWNPAWIDSNTVVGDRAWGDGGPQPEALLFLSSTGSTLRKISLHRGKRVPKGWEGEIPYERRARYLVLGSRRYLLVEGEYGMSDGEHFSCWKVDLKRRTYTALRPGLIAGISPDGKHCLIANHDWVGPYKRGGRRCGALEVVSIKSGKAHPITGPLVSIGGGDWRRSR